MSLVENSEAGQGGPEANFHASQGLGWRGQKPRQLSLSVICRGAWKRPLSRVSGDCQGYGFPRH